MRDQRDWSSHTTTLSGDISGDDDPADLIANRSDNVYTVITLSDPNAVVDGFTITGGSSNANGGGIICQSSATVRHSRFQHNTATDAGGAIYASGNGVAPSIENCVFWKNAAGDGGAISDTNDAGTAILHCTLSQNSAGSGAGGVSMLAGTSITNSIVWGNGTDVSGGGAVAYSCVPGYGGANGNIETDPLLNDAANGDLNLAAGSPAVDSGAAASGTTNDITGTPRTDGAPDMGAYESLLLNAPEIDIQGNGVTILSGDDSPSSDDHSDFGSVSGASGTIVREFTIENLGDVDLNLSGSPLVEITGDAAADFTVTVEPATVVSPAATTSFEITFDPSAVGVRSAQVSVASDDNDESPYTFAIRGRGANVPPVAVATTLDSPASAGDLVELWGSDSYDPDDWPITPLTYSWDYLSGPVFQPGPTITDVSGDWQTASFTPAVDGVYVFELTVSDGDASHRDQLTIRVGTLSLTLPAQATEGDADLTATVSTSRVLESGESVTITLASSDETEIQVSPASVTISAGSDSATFSLVIQEDGLSDGTQSVTISAGADNWIGASGAVDVLDANVPEITLSGNGEIIANGDAMASGLDGTDFGSASINTHVDHTFSITNSGEVQLELTGSPLVEITGPAASDFSVYLQPSASIIPADSTDFIIRFAPTAMGVRSATISISNNDPDENPHTFAVSGGALEAINVGGGGGGDDDDGCHLGGGGATLLPVWFLLMMSGIMRFWITDRPLSHLRRTKEPS